jgi:Protein of unknown function (DUF2786)
MLSTNVLARVRKLLAVAEHPNTPPEEADNAARAAERMIAKHAIDEALLEAAAQTTTQPESRTVLVDPPYASAKTNLVGAVANAHGVRAVTVRTADGPPHVILVGFPTDLQLVDLLYTSLLLQATTSVRRQTATSRAFRRAFLIGFAAEVGERLRATRQEAVAESGEASTAIAVRNRQRDVDAALRARFPHLRMSRTTISDRGGLIAGRQSGANANLGSGGGEIGGLRNALSS